MNVRYNSRKQAIKFSGGATVLNEKQRRKAAHKLNRATGKGEWINVKK